MISLCMIVRDEEDVLGRCLESVSGLFGEIIIADTGSRDGTKAVASRFTDRIYDFEWQDDFSAARNFAFSKATGDYLMWLDADDVVEGENRRLLRGLISELDALSPDVVMLPYNVAFSPSGRVLLSYERERIVRAGRGFEFSGAVHEAITPRGRIIHGSAAISHRKTRPSEPGRNLRILEKIAANGEPEPRMRYYYARELAEAGRLAESAEWYRRCAEDPQAWVENRVSAWTELSGVCRRLKNGADADQALMNALSLGEPRADLCCALGQMFLDRGDLRAARFWYLLAPAQFKNAPGGFVSADFGDYIPFLQLCVISDRLGDFTAAEGYNELASAAKPESEACRMNREYFASKRKNSAENIQDPQK